MAHLLIGELPGGNDVDMIQVAIRRGDHFSFFTADLAHYSRLPDAMVALVFARYLIACLGFDLARAKEQVGAVHACDPIHAQLCLINTRLVEAARLA